MEETPHRPSCCCQKCMIAEEEMRQAALATGVPIEQLVEVPVKTVEPLPEPDSQEKLKAVFAPKHLGRPTKYEALYRDANPDERKKLMRMDPDWIKRIAVLALTDPTVRDAIRKDLTVKEQLELAKEIVSAAQPIAALKMVDLLEDEDKKNVQRAAADIMDRGPLIKNQPQTQWQAPIVIMGFDPEKLWGSTPKAKNVTIKYKPTPASKEKEQ